MHFMRPPATHENPSIWYLYLLLKCAPHIPVTRNHWYKYLFHLPPNTPIVTNQLRCHVIQRGLPLNNINLKLTQFILFTIKQHCLSVKLKKSQIWIFNWEILYFITKMSNIFYPVFKACFLSFYAKVVFRYFQWRENEQLCGKGIRRLMIYFEEIRLSLKWLRQKRNSISTIFLLSNLTSRYNKKCH
jgi:hypothetical protein